MAITKTTLTPDTHGFAVNGVSANASGTEELVATPGVGKYLHLRHVTINSGAAITITLLAGAAAILGPVTYAAGTTLQWNFNPTIKLAANTAINVDASGAGDVMVFVEGYTT
jgi:hypothetical protein